MQSGISKRLLLLCCRLLFVAFAGSVFPQITRLSSPEQTGSEFQLKFEKGAIVSLRCTHGASAIEYIQSGHRLGDVFIHYRRTNGTWQTVQTADIAQPDKAGFSTNASNTGYTAQYLIRAGQAEVLQIEVHFTVEPQSVLWSVRLQNRTAQPLEIGDLAIPFPMNRRSGSTPILKHSFVSGNGSFLYWMPSDNAGPILALTPGQNTSFEYWDVQNREYYAYLHSAVAGGIAKREHGTHWRQPNTSLTLAPRAESGDSQTYGFKLHWANDYDAVRQIIVADGGIDVRVVPGMTVPTNLYAEFALRTRQEITSVKAEFPETTHIECLRTNSDTRVYRIKFSRLGENEVSIHYGERQHTCLEFFVTEPLETLINKRAAFIAAHQVRDTNKWYNGLLCEWNMQSQVQLSPDNYDRIRGFRIYEVTCDDPGLAKPAFLAAKNAELPVQSEVSALDYYLAHFVWGGLQRTTDETYPYAIYGIPDWKKNRDSTDPGRNGQLHLWRIYDYPHVILMYFSMYRVAKNHPEIKTALTADEYLQRAYGTARAMYTIPHEIWNGWSPYGTGFYNELVIVDLIKALAANGRSDEADTLRGFWERKVRNFVNRRQDLFRSEYAFDSTGFESTHAIARYALAHADPPGVTNTGIPFPNAQRFMKTQMAANLFCRGTIEPAYYLLGSDYRGSGGNAYTLTYMSQMGGWAVLDYGLNFATNPAPCLRLGYASYLSAWALMNTGTPETDYGYWYPGQANDGGAGGGFEPAPYGRTWLGQPHHRGAWYYACEIDLGYCGALRTAATVLADDPIFGRFCYGGEWRDTSKGIEVFPKDGLRRRFHALLKSGTLHLISSPDRFPGTEPIVLKDDLSAIRFQLESDNPEPHIAQLRVSGSAVGSYDLHGANKTTSFEIKAGQPVTVAVAVTGSRPQSFVITKREAHDRR